MFKVIGWIGDRYQEQRRVLTGILAADGTGLPPFDLSAVGELTEGHARHVLDRADHYRAQAEGNVTELARILQAMYDEHQEITDNSETAPGGDDPAAGADGRDGDGSEGSAGS